MALPELPVLESCRLDSRSHPSFAHISPSPRSEALCDDLINKCRGIDTTTIEDDGGGLQKTASVENSFRRNAVRSRDQVWHALNDLCFRLPRLLLDRQGNSDSPTRAYPITLRLTAAVVDPQLVRSKKKRRPFVTRSKQCNFSCGKALIAEETDEAEKSEVVHKAVAPLVNALVLNDGDINVVRLNIAVTGFQDLESALSPSSTAASPWAAFATSKENSDDHASKRQRTLHNAKREVSVSSSSRTTAPERMVSNSGGSAKAATESARGDSTPSSCLKLDPAVLAELPADIRAEVCRTYSIKETPKRTIDQFFGKK